MKIALLGYGKMGKVIERIALERGHEIVLKKDRKNNWNHLEIADVAIDFSVPKVAVENISAGIHAGIPVVSGTTGWLEEYDQIKKLCIEKNGSFLYSSNFSLGVNIFFEINEYLAKIMSKQNNYNVQIEEIHHTQKLDEPSGTAISIANGIISNSKYNNWTLEKATPSEIPILAKREGTVPGTHIVTYTSEIDNIEIKHTANSREGFALGAVIAAEWILGKKGIFSMKDVLDLKQIQTN